MIVSIIILLISLILDGILTNFLPYLVGDLSIFTPLFTLTVIFLIYPLFRKKELDYFILVFITGIIYDLLYTNLLFLIIILYETFTGIILVIFNMVPVTISKIIYKITHSLIINIIYGELIYLIINKLPSKYKKISIN